MRYDVTVPLVLRSPVMTLRNRAQRAECVRIPVLVHAVVMGTHPPPPMPARARAAMSASIDGASPQSSVPEPVVARN